MSIERSFALEDLLQIIGNIAVSAFTFFVDDASTQRVYIIRRTSMDGREESL